MPGGMSGEKQNLSKSQKWYFDQKNSRTNRPPPLRNRSHHHHYPHYRTPTTTTTTTTETTSATSRAWPTWPSPTTAGDCSSSCFIGITINKSQGQSLKVAGIDLIDSMFSHCQLCITCSRVGSARNLHILVPSKRMRNIVYREYLCLKKKQTQKIIELILIY